MRPLRSAPFAAFTPPEAACASREPRVPPNVPASSRALPTIESPYVMRAWGFVQRVLSAMRDARRIKA
jgi:hypothetical protein